MKCEALPDWRASNSAVWMSARRAWSSSRSQAATSSVVGVTTPLQLELSDFDSIVACADSIRSLNSPIDILVCNAGMRGVGRFAPIKQQLMRHAMGIMGDLPRLIRGELL